MSTMNRNSTVVCSRDDTGALRLKTSASLIFPSAIRDCAVELGGFEPPTFSLRKMRSKPCDQEK